MAIGEFGGAPALPIDNGSVAVDAALLVLRDEPRGAQSVPGVGRRNTIVLQESGQSAVFHDLSARSVAAACELFERSTRRYGRPEWRIDSTLVGGERVPVHVSTVWERPFCKLIHFERMFEHPPKRPQPRLLIVAPMSGHYATLLRGTVEAFLPNHDVYVTDWVDARMVPLSEGRFDLDDYIDYLISILHALGGDISIVAVCQPSVPVIAAVALMEADDDPYVPNAMVLMGGPIDTRVNPTAVNKLAEKRGIDWFRTHVITKVPFPNPGFMRDVYPGFLQLNGFVSMNLDRHIEAHKQLFMHLVRGDGDSAQKHKEFYDEYLAVMDLAAEFYLQTVDTVFVRHALAEGQNDASRPAGRSGPHQARRAAHRRRRARRYFRRRPDRGGAPPVRQYSAGPASALAAARRRTLRRVQRFALPLGDRAAHFRFRAVDESANRRRARPACVPATAPRCTPRNRSNRPAT